MTKRERAFVSQLVNTTARENEVHTRDLNLALTIVQGIEPKDTVETLLATHTNEAVAERRRLNDLVRDAKMGLRQLFGREQ